MTMPDLKTVDIPDVEVARVGVWRSINAGTVPITADDLDTMVAAAHATADLYQPPVKLGHEMLQAIFGELAGDLEDGEPAFGWADPKSARRDGERLLVALRDVPAKLAEFLRVKAWRNRSPEIAFDREIGGKRWRRFLTAVSLLGAVPPAIHGMADLYSGQGDRPPVAVLFGEPEDMGEEELVELARRVLESFRLLATEAEPLIRRRRGAPMARSLFTSFEAQLRRAARVDTAAMSGGTPMDGPDVRGALKLDETTAPGDVVKALLAADAGALGEVVKLAGDMGFADADQFVAWLAGRLGVAPGDLNAIATAVAEAMGLDTSTEQPPADGTTPPEPNMAEKEPTKMSESEIALTKRLAELEGRVARDDAAKAVDALIAAGKAVPAQRDSLIGFRVGAPAQFTAWAKDLPVVVHMGEQGTAGGQDAEVLTEADFQAARDQNLDLDVMRAHKRAQAAATNV